MGWRRWNLVGACVVAVSVTGAAAQPPAAAAQPPAATPAKSAPAADPLARDTPRGTVLGFLSAARKGEIAAARQYLDTRADEAASQALAGQLFVVLDAKLPARLPQISDDPLGSRANPLAPHLEVVGAIEAESGEVEVVLERVERRGSDPVWLFSKATLDAVPALYQEVTRRDAASRLPDFVGRTGLGGLKRLEWLVLLGGIPLFFIAAALVNRLLVAIVRPLWRRFAADATRPITVFPLPARLLMFALLIHLLLPAFPLSLRAYASSAPARPARSRLSRSSLC